MPYRELPAVTPAFNRLMREANYSILDLSRKAKVNVGLLRRLGKGGVVPPNHPFLPKIAAALGLEMRAILPFCAKQEMNGHQMKRIISRRRNAVANGKGDAAPGVALVPVKKDKTALAPKGPYNKVRKLPKNTRQIMRGIVDVVNLNIMKGNRYLDLRAIPTEPFAAMLSDYMAKSGIKGPMLLDPRYAETFDPR